jgi:probable rRNA maturation factor
MIFLEIAETCAILVDAEQLKRAAQTTLQHSGAPSECSLTIVLTDDTQIRQLNYQYRGMDAPTDVLAFPSDYIDPETQTHYLGDIIISVQRAQAQAFAEQHPLEEELQLLIVHGTLHLLGFDHQEEQAALQMWKVQGKILRSLGCSIENPPF